ncbi:MAG: PorT family protein [Treponema sp.]|jgi:hypothetical protein|nr:PorT family protein [Treponema sp.]
MKRFLLAAAVLAVTTLTVSAQTRWTVGGRLGPGFAFNKLEGDYKDSVENEFSTTGLSFDDSSNWVFAAAVYGGYTIFPKFSIQAELGLMINNGMTVDTSYPGYGKVMKVKASFTSLEIPVLARYDFLDGPFTLGVLAGPYVSIPLGKLKAERTVYVGTGSGKEDYSINTRLGITAGVAAGYKVGPGSIVADLRFLNDFSPVKLGDGSKIDLFTRRGINLTLGYAIKF